MSEKSFAKMLVLMVVSVGICADLARADGQQLQEKLSEDISIRLDEVTIVEALEKIGQKAGLKIALSEEAIWKLPQGKATRLSVTLDGPFAESMSEMLNAFFMRYAVGEEEITIYPRPELGHILGRPTARQLELLKAIYTRSTKDYLESPQNTINAALGEAVTIVPYHALDNVDRMLHELGGKNQQRPRPEGLTFPLSGPMTVANILEQTKITVAHPRPYIAEGEWYLSGPGFPNQIPEIRVVSVPEFRQAKLDQIVDISFKDESASVILQRLTSWAGMELTAVESDTSWLEGKISLEMQNIKLKQALMNMINLLGGKYEIDVERNYLRVFAPEPTRPKTNEQQKSPKSSKEADDDYVGKISIPMEGGKYFIEFMLRRSDLPEGLKNLREQKIREALGKEARDAKIKEVLRKHVEPGATPKK